MKRYFLYFSVVLVFSFLIIVTVITVQDESTTFAIPLQHYFKRSLEDCFQISPNAIFKEKTSNETARNLVENLPTIYLGDNPKVPVEFNKTCAKFPKLFDIKYTGDFWQSQETDNGTLQLFNAYIDDRSDIWHVRIVAAYDQFYSNESFYCHLWYDGVKEPVVVKSDNLTWLWIKGWGGNKTGLYHSYMVTCPLVENQVPMSVSVVQNACDNASNNLKISYRRVAEKKQFVVCVKGLNFPFEDKSVRLAEWIELLFILGADKINFYDFNIHPNNRKLLDYYAKQGKVEVTPISLLGGVSNSPYLQNRFLRQMVLPRRLQEVIPYNDCLYKHLQQFKFVVLLDTDEVIVPFNGTWNDLIKTIYIQNKSSYMARNIYFLDSHQHDHDWFVGIPKFMHMLQHVYRAENYTKPGYFVKGFHDTGQVLTLHNHFPFKCLTGCRPVSIDMNLAHLQHYRGDCVKEVKDCDLMKTNSVMDTRLWDYKDELIRRVLYVLTKLDLLDEG